MVMEAMRLSLLEHEAQQRREEERSRREAATDPGGPSVTSGADEAAPPRVQPHVTESLVPGHSSPHGLQVDGPSTGTSARSRSSTPVSGQTTSPSPSGATVDDLNNISHSIEQSISQPMMDTPAHIGNCGTHAVHASNNDERSGSLCSTAIHGQGHQSEDLARPLMISCIPLSSSLSDTDSSRHL